MNYDSGPFLEDLRSTFELDCAPKLIRSNTNLIYDCGNLILRLTPNSFRSADEVRRELHWMAFVGSKTEDVVHLIGDGPADTQQFMRGEESFTVAKLEKIHGEPVAKEQWNSDHFERLGKLTGMMHRIGQEYAPSKDVALTEWDEIPEADLARHLPDDERELPRLNQAASSYLGQMPREAGSYGPIHYDIHAGNYLLTSDDRLVLFDFENSCRGHHINDIAVVLYYARLNPLSAGITNFASLFLEAFWRGYETEYAIPQEEVLNIPWLLLNRGLLVYAYVLKIWPGELDEEQSKIAGRIDDLIRHDRTKLNL